MSRSSNWPQGPGTRIARWQPGIRPRRFRTERLGDEKTAEEVGVAKYLELRRHTDNDDDALSADGVRKALAIGAGLQGNYEVLVSTGAQRATQTLACFVAGLGQKVSGGVVVEEGLRSKIEDRWKAAYQEAGSGGLHALRSADPELVEQDSATLGAALRRVIDRLSDGGRALLVGHSPTNEAAVLGLTGVVVEPMSKGGGVLVVEEDESFRVEPLPERHSSPA